MNMKPDEADRATAREAKHVEELIAETLARDSRERARALVTRRMSYDLVDNIAAALDAAYARGRAAGPVVDEATVERMARAIDPGAWRIWNKFPGRAGGGDKVADRIANSMQIARAAIAAIPAPPAGEPNRE